MEVVHGRGTMASVDQLDLERAPRPRLTRVSTRNELAIGEAARESGLSADTLRYYERIGLIGPVARAAGDQRRYTGRDLAWIEFLKRLRATGMPIALMKRYADLRREGPSTLVLRRGLLEGHGRATRIRIDELRADLRAIEDKIDHYRALENDHGE